METYLQEGAVAALGIYQKVGLYSRLPLLFIIGCSLKLILIPGVFAGSTSSFF
jgi:hypothetical protein